MGIRRPFPGLAGGRGRALLTFCLVLLVGFATTKASSRLQPVSGGRISGDIAGQQQIARPVGVQNQAVTEQSARQTYDSLPLAFEENVGQAGDRTRFLTHSDGFQLSMTDSGPVFLFPQGGNVEKKAGAEASPLTMTPVKLELMNASSTVATGVQPLAGTANYLIGNDPAKHITKILGAG